VGWERQEQVGVTVDLTAAVEEEVELVQSLVEVELVQRWVEVEGRLE
jgi:hypothetical protein